MPHYPVPKKILIIGTQVQLKLPALGGSFPMEKGLLLSAFNGEADSQHSAISMLLRHLYSSDSTFKRFSEARH